MFLLLLLLLLLNSAEQSCDSYCDKEFELDIQKIGVIIIIIIVIFFPYFKK